MADYTFETFSNALGVAEPDWQAEMVQDIYARDQVLPLLTSVVYQGTQLDWWREKTMGEDVADFAAADARLLVTANNDLPQVDAEYRKMSTKATRWGCYISTDNRIETELGNVFSHTMLKAKEAQKRLLRNFSRHIWKGPDIAGENTFTSIPSDLDAEFVNEHLREGALSGDSADPQQTIAATKDTASGVGFQLNNLDDARFRIRTGSGVSHFASHPREITSLYHQMRTVQGGMTLLELRVPGLSDVSVPQYAGIPWLQCDYISIGESDTYGSDSDQVDNETSIYALDLNSAESLKTVHYAPGAMRAYYLGRINEKRDEEFYQFIMNGNKIFPSIRSICRIRGVSPRA